jgi:hypothetical protein
MHAPLGFLAWTLEVVFHGRSFAVRLRSRNFRRRSGDGGDGRELSSSSSQSSSSAIKSAATSPRTLIVWARRIASFGLSRSELPFTTHSARHRVSAKHASYPSMSLIAFCISSVACKNAAVSASSSFLCVTSFSLHLRAPPHQRSLPAMVSSISCNIGLFFAHSISLHVRH